MESFSTPLFSRLWCFVSIFRVTGLCPAFTLRINAFYRPSSGRVTHISGFFFNHTKGGATPADCTRPCGYARCICPSSFASVTSSFAFAAEDVLSRFRFAHIVPDSQSFVKHFSVALKRYMVVTSRSGCHVSHLTCLDCTRLLSDYQALFFVVSFGCPPDCHQCTTVCCICQALFSAAPGVGCCPLPHWQGHFTTAGPTCQHFFRENFCAPAYTLYSATRSPSVCTNNLSHICTHLNAS